MGAAKRKEDELTAALQAISAGTLMIVRPGDKVIVRVMADVSQQQFGRLHQVCASFFGAENFLLIGGAVEFMVARPEDAQVIAPADRLVITSEPGAN